MEPFRQAVGTVRQDEGGMGQKEEKGEKAEEETQGGERTMGMTERH